MKKSPIRRTLISSSALAQAGIVAQLECHVHRDTYPCHYSGHLRIPAQPGNNWPAVYGQRHARAFPTRGASRIGGSGRKRDRNIYSERRRLHADSGHFALHPWIQPGSLGRTCGRYRRHPFAQPAHRRRFQIQSAQRRTSRHRVVCSRPKSPHGPARIQACITRS
jgi:hypothetical protein